MTVFAIGDPADADIAALVTHICQVSRKGPVLHLDLFLMSDASAKAFQLAIDQAIAENRLVRTISAAGFAYEARFCGVDIDAAHRHANTQSGKEAAHVAF